LNPALVTLALLFLACLALSATFSASETAVFSIDRLELRRFEQSPSRRKRLVAAVAARPERLLGGILLGNTLANVAASSVTLAIVRTWPFPAKAEDVVGTSVLLCAAAVLLFGEVLPKGIAVHWPARTSVLLVPVLVPLLRALAPASRLLERLAQEFLRGLRVTEDRSRAHPEWRDLKDLFEDAQSGQGLTAGEGRIAANVFAFFETRAYEIMTPRVDVLAVSADLPREDLVRQVIAARHRRLPLYRGSLDHIVGFVNAKELLLSPEAPLETILRPVHFVPERARLTRILSEIQARRLSLLVVVTEFGGTAGILTQEDLIEEVVGEIFDEQERDEAPEIETVGEGLWRVNGLLNLADLADLVGLDLPSGPAETVAGHVAHLLGRPPRRGDTAAEGPVGYRVLQVRRHRAHRVQIGLLPVAGREENPG
jgi:CBS domain containing-hemolysin-like protein